MEVQAILDVIKAFFNAIITVLKEIGFIKAEDATEANK